MNCKIDGEISDYVNGLQESETPEVSPSAKSIQI